MKSEAEVVLVADRLALAHDDDEVGLVAAGGEGVAVPLADGFLHLENGFALGGAEAGLGDFAVDGFNVNGVRGLEDLRDLELLVFGVDGRKRQCGDGEYGDGAGFRAVIHGANLLKRSYRGSEKKERAQGKEPTQKVPTRLTLSFGR